MKLSRMLPVALALAMPATAATQMTGAPKATTAEKIRSAMRGGPAQIAANATIMDWPVARGGKPVQLRAGTNAWVCYPRSRKDVDNAMCFDPTFQKWLDAYRSRTTPQLSGIGIAYLLAGGFTGSARDPFATEKTATNDWGHDGPGLMVIAPDSALYAGLPTKRSDGPYIMFAGTPYAHIMVPVGARK